MKRNIKIAIYAGEVPSTTFIERLIKGLADGNHLIYCFGFQRSKVKQHTSIHYFTFKNRLDKLFLLLKYSLFLYLFKPKDKRKLDAIIKTKKQPPHVLKIKYYPVLFHQPSIFHLQWAKSVEDWMWVQKFGIKLVVSLRGAHINYSPIIDAHLAESYKNAFSKVDGFHAVSSAIGIEATKYNANQHKIKTVYSGLDLSQIPFKLKRVDKKTPLNILSIGRPHWIKGYTYALNAMKFLKIGDVDFNYTIIGVDSDEELLYQRSQLRLINDVTFIKKVPFDEVIKRINKADVLLLSSIKEGIANVVLEAMASGTLVVSTNCGGLNEVIQNDVNGYLDPIRDAKKLAKTLKRVSKLSSKSYQKMSLAARNTIENQHSKEKMISDIQELYLNVLNN